VDQTVEAASVPVTLEQVVITPWATRAAYRFHLSNEMRPERTLVVASLRPAGGSSTSGGFGNVLKGHSWQYFTGDFTAQPGEWTVTINELVFPPEPSGGKIQAAKPGDTKRLAGPWVFRFEVP
jgi:hypothetical protein